jgi:hypothetical protein
MRVKITKPCVIEVLPGSEVEITEYQFRFITDYCKIEQKKETPEKAQKQTRKARK